MNNHFYRSLLIWGVLALALALIWPSIGWMMMSQEARAARLEQWKEEDAVYVKRSLLGDAAQAVKRWAQCDRDQVINLGLDLQGGIHMVVGFELTAEQKERGLDDEYVQRLVLQRIRRRISEFEAQEPVIQALGTNQVQIQLPGEKDVDRARRLITRTALLTFHVVSGTDETADALRAAKDAFPGRLTPYLKAPVGRGMPFRVPEEHIERIREVIAEINAAEDVLPAGKKLALSQPPNPWDEYQGYYLYLIDREPLMTGEGLSMAAARPNQQDPGSWEILFQFQGESSRQFGEVTGANVGEVMAIVLDKVVCSAPTIRDRIDGTGTITGSFSPEEASDLAIALNSGSMPVQLREDYTGVVGASLGADSVRKGVISSLVGLILVALFMVVYYRLGGLVALLALVFNAITVLAALAYFNATLTLPGIAGLILTIGMAVDANVLIFERIREELRNGRSLLASIESGYGRAMITILDANITTLIAAAVLMEFGTGPIEGFAVTLSIGVCTSVFAALLVSRAMMDFLAERKVITELSMMSLLKPDTHVPFMAKRRFAFTLSAAVIVIGMAVFGLRGADNFGVDFTEGTNMIVALDTEEPVQVGDVRNLLIENGFDTPIVQEYQEPGMDRPNQFVIRVGESGGQVMPIAPPIEGDDVETPAAEQPQDDAAAETAESGEAPADAGSAENEAAAAVEASDTPEPAPPEEPVAEEAAVEGLSPVELADVSEAGLAALETGEITVSSRVQNALAGLVAGDADKVLLEKVETVGPAVGKQLRIDAGRAIFYALLFIVAYLWFRFELKFAVGAVVALVHDVLVTVGIFAMFGREISMPVVAALLTIIGYSLNDTIVVFDRVREDLQLYRGRGMAYADILDLSINQTLSRTLLTSLTTLFVVVVYFFFGGSAINDFAFTLILGIIVGTYSSIFVASPVVHFWQWIADHRRQQTAAGKSDKGGKKSKGKGKGKAKDAPAES